VLLPIAERFDPDLVLVSCGFDAAAGDPLGAMRISPPGYALLTARLARLARGRLVLVLEGGYNLTAIARSAEACLRVLLGEDAPDAEVAEPSVAARVVIETVRRIQQPHWPGVFDSA
jgi:histone deacetylase 6